MFGAMGFCSERSFYAVNFSCRVGSDLWDALFGDGSVHPECDSSQIITGHVGRRNDTSHTIGPVRRDLWSH